MRFRAAHKLTCYLMVGSALGTLASSASLSLAQLAAFAVVACVSWFAEGDGVIMRWLARVEWPLKVLVLAFFSITVFSLVRSFPEPDLTALLNLVLILLAYKLLSRRTNRDYLQIYILSFLLILAASWLAQSALFAVGFAVYVVALTWSLILFHLRREIEDNYLVKHEAASAAQRVTAARVLDSRRVVGKPFFFATALAAVGVMVGATLVFALAPRVGIGFLTGAVRRRTALVGFSDQVQLGHHGALSSDNQTVVLRASVGRLAQVRSGEARDRIIQMMYWRGTVYDTYGNGQWLRSRTPVTRTLVQTAETEDGTRWSWLHGPEEPDEAPSHAQLLREAERQEVQLVALTHPVAFALDRPVALAVPRPPPGSFVTTVIEGNHSGEATLRSARALPGGRSVPVADFAGARYIAYSIDSLRRIRPEQAKALDELPAELLAAHLQVPPDLQRRLLPLAKRITVDAATPAAKAQAIVSWLNKNKRYSLELKRDERFADPVEDFLLAQQGGHCEYFASAAALLMRLVGVPTRYVNGFLGGEWNDLTGHVTVRDNRAHSWIEAYFSGFGWTRLDATPALMRPVRMGRVKQVLDSIESWWGQWVTDYDASRQIELAKGLAKSLGLSRGRGNGIVWPRPERKVVVGLTLVAAAAYLIFRAVRRKRRDAPSAGPEEVIRGSAHRLYDRALRALTDLGLHRQAPETPREFLTRVETRLPELGPAFGRVTQSYERVRFAQVALSPLQMQRLTADVAEVERLCKLAHQQPRAA